MPAKNRSTQRSKSRFQMRLTATERKQLGEDADLAGMSISELVRRRTFGRPILVATDLTMIRELRRLGGLQKLAMNTLTHHCEVADECATTIRALRSAIERVAQNDRKADQ
jgi:hypothetical protein